MDKNKLDSIRSEIDIVDRELARLLEKRMELVSHVTDYKRETKTKVLDNDREKKVIENVISQVSDPVYQEFIKASFECIMANSREFQNKRLTSVSKTGNKFVLIGEHLSHSLSPLIHGDFFRKAEIKGTYDLLEVPPSSLSGILDFLKAEGYNGLNVTIPYKTEIMRTLDVLSKEALRIGAVNTIKLGDKSIGYNTDYFGFGKALDYYGLSAKNKACAILGSGGSSRAVVSWLEDHGASQIVIVTRDTDSTSLKYPGLSSIELNEFMSLGFDLVVNTTPLGMWPNIDASPLKKEQLEGAGFLMDIIYNPEETLLMKFAKELGIHCANGLYMLAAQAVNAQEIWQGQKFQNQFIEDIIKDIKKI